MEDRTLAQAHGLFNVVGGAWPLLHMRSFEAVTGPKVDRWLVRTVAGLMVTNGLVQLAASRASQAGNASRAEDSDRLAEAARVGIATALPLAAIDLVYAPKGRISKVYLLDAAAELAWIGAWVPRLRRRD